MRQAEKGSPFRRCPEQAGKRGREKGSGSFTGHVIAGIERRNRDGIETPIIFRADELPQPDPAQRKPPGRAEEEEEPRRKGSIF